MAHDRTSERLRAQRLRLGTAVALVAGCTSTNPAPGLDPAAVAAHVEAIARWRAERDARLRDPTGWLTLAGLYWLAEGSSVVGSDPDSAVGLPASAPAKAGVIHLTAGAATFTAEPAAAALVRVAGAGVAGASVAAAVPLVSDDPGPPTVVELGRVRFHLIARDGKLAVRVKDEESRYLAGFDGVDSFPVELGWRLEGRFEARPEPVQLEVPSVLGRPTREWSPGWVVFSRGGVEHRLEALAEAEDEELFVVFGDATNGRSTYGGGRFLSIDRPAPGSSAVVIDFNKAYNPPCAFTPYATCPLPARSNILALEVNAGEKSYGHH